MPIINYNFSPYQNSGVDIKIDVVALGWFLDFSYDWLKYASLQIQQGAEFVQTAGDMLCVHEGIKYPSVGCLSDAIT